MTTREIIDGIEMLRFFNQRAGRELWGDKSKQIQDEDIEHADRILRSAISALEKQIPKKPIHSIKPRYGMGETYYDYTCPTCGNFICFEPQGDTFFSQGKGIHICVRCYQALDWTEGEVNRNGART